MRLASFTCSALLIASTLSAQTRTPSTFYPPETTECSITCVGTPGEKGDPGEKGEPGERGPAGPQIEPWTLRPYDLQLPAGVVSLRELVAVPGGHFVLIYSAVLHHAALIDPRSGMAQIVPIDPRLHGGLIPDGVRAITPSFFEWTVGETTWGHQWRTRWPWVPMGNYILDSLDRMT